MTDREQKAAAKTFAEEWKDKGYEKGQSQPFWLSLLRDVLGIEHPEQYISFEDRVLNGEKIDRSSINKATTITADVQQRVYSEMYNDTGMGLNY